MNQRNVYELFPDPIFHYKLENYKQINKELLNYILELQKKDKEEITSVDIEHAVRRVGTEVLIAPITDNLFLLQIVNITLGMLLFALPFSLLCLF